MDSGVEREEVGFGVFVVWEGGLLFSSVTFTYNCTEVLGAYKSLMRNSRASTIQPCLFVRISRRHKSRSGDLLSIQPKPDLTGIVLPVGNSSGDSFGYES